MENMNDVAGGQERVPLMCFISQQEGPPAPDFQYVTSYVMSHDPPMIDGHGCCCDGPSDHIKPCCGEQCPCCYSPIDGSPCYLEDGTPSFMALSGATEPPYLSECGPACHCHSSGFQKPSGTQPSQDKLEPATSATGVSCRVSQQGLRHHMTLKPTAKGWSAFAMEEIQRGCFVCTYLGEPVTNKEAAARLHAYDAAGEGHALLVVRQVLPTGKAAVRLNIDASRYGNAARFFNHSCDGGNLSLMLVRRSGEMLPYVALFASRDIHPGQELTFCYGSSPAGGQQQGELQGWQQGQQQEQHSGQQQEQHGGQQGEPLQQEPREQPGVEGRHSRQQRGQRQPGVCGSRVRCLCGTAGCSGWMPGEEA